MKTIPNEAYEIKNGLYLHAYSFKIAGVSHLARHLYSSQGYCFYDKTEEVYRENENGDVVIVAESDILPTERKYMQYASIPEIKDLNDFISVEIQEGFEIV